MAEVGQKPAETGALAMINLLLYVGLSFYYVIYFNSIGLKIGVKQGKMTLEFVNCRKM